MLTNDNKLFQVTASYLLDLAQRADELFKESDDGLRQKLLEYLLSNIELKDKKLSYMLNDPFKTIIEAKKKSPNGSESNLWCGYRDSNPGPLPWQGSALSAELHPRVQVYFASHSASPTCCAPNTSPYKFFDSFLLLMVRIEMVFANEVLSQKI